MQEQSTGSHDTSDQVIILLPLRCWTKISSDNGNATQSSPFSGGFRSHFLFILLWLMHVIIYMLMLPRQILLQHEEDTGNQSHSHFTLLQSARRCPVIASFFHIPFHSHAHKCINTYKVRWHAGPGAARRRIIWSGSWRCETNLTGADGESDSMGRGGGGIGGGGGEVTAWNKATEEINGFIGRQTQAAYYQYILILYMRSEQFNKSLHITQLIAVNWFGRTCHFKHLTRVIKTLYWTIAGCITM